MGHANVGNLRCKDLKEWWDAQKHEAQNRERRCENRLVTQVRIHDEESGHPAPLLTDAKDKLVTGRRDGGSSAGNAVTLRVPKRDLYSWTSIIQQYTKLGQGRRALAVYEEMRSGQVEPNSYSLVAALKACGSVRDLKVAKQIHAEVVKSGFQSHVYVGTMLIDVYAKCGSLIDARSVFEKMPRRDVVSWNAMITGYAQTQDGAEALRLYGRMQQKGVVPNDRTFVGVLKACSSLGAQEDGNQTDGKRTKEWCLEQVRSIHKAVLKGGFESDIFVGNMLVDAYAKCGSLVDARYVFEAIPHRNVVSWTAMIFAYAQMEQGEVALKLYTRMRQEGVAPDDRAFVSALKACSSLLSQEDANKGDEAAVKKRCLELVKCLHSDIRKGQFESDAFVVTMLVDVYGKCGSVADARLVFEKMHHRDVASWNAMILGYAQLEEGEEALRLYARMQQEGVKPEDRTFVAALKACGVVAALEKGKEIHAQISEAGVGAADLFVPNALIDMYGRCGSMVDAQQVFDEMSTTDIVTWSALIAGYARQGEFNLVFFWFQKMKEVGIEPNGITFLSLLTACSHAGLVDEGQKFFEAMLNQYSITPGLEHYICLIGLLGRAGQLDRAMDLVNNMPFQPDVGIWKTLLGACRKWRNMELGKQAFERAVGLDKNDVTAYVLMSNIFSDACMWEDVKKIQEMVVRSRAWKQPGQSWWTDISGIVHTFLVGDQEHPGSSSIFGTLTDMSARMKEGGSFLGDPELQYGPDGDRNGTFSSLCGHSKRLTVDMLCS